VCYNKKTSTKDDISESGLEAYRRIAVMSKKKGHSMGNIQGGSVKKNSSGEYEANVKFANGVTGTGTGKSPAMAQRAAVEDAKSQGGIGKWILLGAIVLLAGGL
jgi:hypothetical protein